MACRPHSEGLPLNQPPFGQFSLAGEVTGIKLSGIWGVEQPRMEEAGAFAVSLVGRAVPAAVKAI